MSTTMSQSLAPCATPANSTTQNDAPPFVDTVLTNTMIDKMNADMATSVDAYNTSTAALFNAMNGSADLYQKMDVHLTRITNQIATQPIGNNPAIPGTRALRYPHGISPGGPLPLTVAAAREMTGTQYTAAIAALPGLAPLPENTDAATLRAHFLNYIGCPL